MKSRDFCYWLQGLFELGEVEALTPAQTACIRNHLNLVFLHEIDPSEPGDPVVSQAVHDGSKPKPTPSQFSRPPVGSGLLRC